MLGLYLITLCLLLLNTFHILANPLGKSGERISVTKCNEYKEIYRYRYVSPLPPPFDEEYLGDLKCPNFKEPFIVGGREAFQDEFPHMVSLQYKLKNGRFHHGCGGTLISSQFVLTAGHCINAEVSPGEKKSPEKVILGDISLRRGGSSSRRKEMTVSKIIVHPKYNPAKNSYNDIALIKLNGELGKGNGEFDYNERPAIRPACLAQPDQNLGSGVEDITASGWGKISDHSDVQNILQAVNFTVDDNPSCQETYSDMVVDFRARFPEGVLSSLICAGETNKDTCQGDSGGPITEKPLKDLPCMDYVVGITSVGPSNCGSGTPGIYTRVDRYIDWIEENVWINP